MNSLLPHSQEAATFLKIDVNGIIHKMNSSGIRCLHGKFPSEHAHLPSFHQTMIILASTTACYHSQKQPPEVFYKKGFLKNIAKFTGKQLCQSFYFNNAAGLRPAALLKKDSGTVIFL